MAINSGVNISKAVGYAVLEIPTGVDITKAVAYAVLQDGNAPLWPPLTAPDGTVGIPYSFVFATTGGAPTTFTVLSGSLPSGLTLANVSGNTGQITGVPTLAGTYSFTLLATNAVGSDYQAFTIVIHPAPPARGNIDYDQIRATARQGFGGQFQMFGGGSPAPGNVAIYDTTGNVIDGGAGPTSPPIRTSTVSTTLTASDYTLVAIVPFITVTLPAVAAGKIYNIKNGNSTSGQTISVTSAGGVLIDTSATVSLGATASLTVQFDGSIWRVL